MVEENILLLVVAFASGVIVGAILLTIVNRLRTGTSSPAKLKREYEGYQEAVEQHFDETSRKFKDMTEQYQDLYKHLATGATNLCRTENISPVLSEMSDSESLLIEKTAESSIEDSAVENSSVENENIEVSKSDTSDAAPHGEADNKQNNETADASADPDTKIDTKTN